VEELFRTSTEGYAEAINAEKTAQSTPRSSGTSSTNYTCATFAVDAKFDDCNDIISAIS